MYLVSTACSPSGSIKAGEKVGICNSQIKGTHVPLSLLFFVPLNGSLNAAVDVLLGKVLDILGFLARGSKHQRMVWTMGALVMNWNKR